MPWEKLVLKPTKKAELTEEQEKAIKEIELFQEGLEEGDDDDTADPAAVGAGSGARSIARRSSGVTEFGKVFLRSPAMSQTRTVWSREAERTRSSFGWNCAHIT